MEKVNSLFAISVEILDCIVFNNELNNKYTESIMRIWCNILGKKQGLSKDTVSVLKEDEMMGMGYMFMWDNFREACPTEWAIMHGIDVDENGHSPYWTSSPSPLYYTVRFVYSSGLFGYYWYGTANSNIGVRPALKLD